MKVNVPYMHQYIKRLEMKLLNPVHIRMYIPFNVLYTFR